MQQAIFFTLFLSLTVLLAVVQSQTPVPTTCGQLSSSCAKCNASPMNCRYVWTQPGCYNSSINGTCLPQTVVDQLLWYNEYNKTVFAYALKEEEINTTRGQYLLSKRESSQDYGAYVVVCWDRNLCYCKPVPPPPPSTIVVTVTDCSTNAPLSTSVNPSVSLSSVNLTAPVNKAANTSGLVQYYPLQPGAYQIAASAVGYYVNTTSVGSLTYNQTVYVQLCLVQIPCIVNVVTWDTSTNLTLSGVTVSLNSASIPSQTSDANGKVQYSISAGAASIATGTKTGYSTATGSFACSRNGTVTVNLYLTPLPNQVYVQVIDIQTLLPITSASVALTSGGNTVSSSGVNGTAVAYFANVAAGTYGATASASGYGSNSTSVGTLTYNQTIFVIIYLGQLPCVVTITTYDASTNITLPTTTIVYTGSTTTTTTDNNGVLTTTYTNLANVPSGFVASKVGYTSATSTFSCSRNGTVNVNVYLAPLPNDLEVEVYDITTLTPILTAFVTVTGAGLSQTSAVTSPNASVYYDHVPAGTYNANASAAGYNQNSTLVGTVVRNNSISAVIFLTPLPCNLVVYTRTLNTNLTLPGVNLGFNGQVTGSGFVSDSNGVASFTVPPLSTASIVSGSLSGYSNGSADFQCSRGATVSVIIYLNQIFQITVAAVDASSPGAPYIFGSTILLSGVRATQVSPTNPAAYIYQVQSFPVTFTVTGSAPGYTTQVQSYRFTQAAPVYNISLIPKQFDLFFTPSELFDDGTNRILTSTGSFDSLYVPPPNYGYVPKNGTIGGSVLHYTNFSGVLPSAYAPNQIVNNNTYYAAPFYSNTPTSVGPFFVQQQSIAHMATNFNSSVPNVFLVFIPDYYTTPNRQLLIPLPYKRSSAFIEIVITVYTPSGSIGNFPNTFASIQLNLAGSSPNLQTLTDLTGNGAVFESLIAFGQPITSIDVNLAGELFNKASSGWVDSTTGALSATFAPITWPPAALTAQLFTALPNGQQARKVNSKLYQEFNYKAVLSPSSGKKRVNKN